MAIKYRKKTRKPVRKSNVEGIKIPSTLSTETIRFLLRDLDNGNIASAKNFLRSFLLTKKDKDITEMNLPLSEVADKYVKKLRENITDAEKEFEKNLKTIGIGYVFQQKISPDSKKFYVMDFYVPDKKICFEIDGNYHSTEEQIKKDNKRTRDLQKLGIKVIRIPNKEVFMNSHCINIIMNALHPTQHD